MEDFRPLSIVPDRFPSAKIAVKEKYYGTNI